MMRSLGPYEPAPHIGVAVSGGGDSMALLHLAVEWATSDAGCVTAFTIDHDLRPGSAGDAATVTDWCRYIGCSHEILVWQHEAPITSAIQERARNARYRLLQEAAGRHAILHMLVAHHADDQSETIAMRRNHGSGEDGLAGMPAILALDRIRILRPLLAIPSQRLKDTCHARGQGWIEDPSNQSSRFERVRVRQALAQDMQTLAMPDFALARSQREGERAALLARAVTIYPTGHARLDIDIMREATAPLIAACLGEILRTIGDVEHSGPRLNLQGLAYALLQPVFQGATLGGCRLRLVNRDVLITREHRGGLPENIRLEPNAPAHLGSFHVVSAMSSRIAEVGSNWPRKISKPYASDIVRMQPGFYDDLGLAAVPTLGYLRAGIPSNAYTARFTPKRNMAYGIFPIV